MVLLSSLLNTEGLHSLWDVAARCYLLLQERVESQDVFLVRFYGGRGSNLSDSLQAEFRLVRCAAQEIVRETLERKKRFADALVELCSLGVGVDAAAEIGGSVLEGMVLWEVLRGFDAACQEEGLLSGVEKRGPLNRWGTDRVGVYLKFCGGMVEKVREKASLLPISEVCFNEELTAIMFYERRNGAKLPHVVRPVSEKTAVLGSASEGNSQHSGEPFESLRVGFELFHGAHIADYEDRRLPISFDFVEGSSVVARYAGDYAERFSDLVKKSVDEADEQGCQILIFPEMVMPDVLTDVLQKHLKTRRCQSLKLVVAGSGHREGPPIEEGGSLTNMNVCRLFDGRGWLIGEYHKRSAYSPRKRKGAMGPVEHLYPAGDSCTMVDVSGLGRVLPAICRDFVSDDRYSLDLVRDFYVHVLCVPAWSKSIEDAFGDYLKVLTGRHRALGFVCDACAPRTSIFEGRDGSVPEKLTTALAVAPRHSSCGNDDKYVRCDAACTPACWEACKGEYELSAAGSELSPCLRVLDVSYDEKGFCLGGFSAAEKTD